MPNLCIIPARALDDPAMTYKQLKALLAVGTFTQRDGSGVWASNRTLAERAGLDERDLRRALADLEGRAYIRRTRRARRDGGHSTSIIDIVLYPQTTPDHPGEEGRIAPGEEGQITPGEEGRITPPNDPEERPRVSEASTTTTTARARMTLTNAPGELPSPYRLAYEALRESAKNPVAYDATLRAALEGLHGKAWTAEDVGQALLDLWANGEGWNSSLFRAYLQKHARAQERNAALDAETATKAKAKSQSLIPEEWRRKAEVEFGRAAGGAA